MKHKITLAIAALCLAACSEPTPPTAMAPATPAPANQIDLQALSGPEIEAGGLTGELGCVFNSNDGSPLLIGRGNVQRAERSAALVRNAGEVRQLESDVTGGYDAMVDGVTFTDATLSVRVEPGARQPEASEQAIHAGTLHVRRGEAERTYEGRWTCGP